MAHANEGSELPSRKGRIEMRELEFGGAQEANVDGVHASGADGLHAEVGVFVAAAFIRGNADAAGGFEEDVGSGFLTGDVFAGDDGVEEIANSEVGQDLFDDGF